MQLRNWEIRIFKNWADEIFKRCLDKKVDILTVLFCWLPYGWTKNLIFGSILLNFLMFFVLSKSESVKFSLIESVICLFTDSSVKKYFSLLNQLIFTDSSVKKIFFTEIISEIWLIYSNLFLAIWISQVSLITSVKIDWFDSENYFFSLMNQWKFDWYRFREYRYLLDIKAMHQPDHFTRFLLAGISVFRV